MMVVAAIVSFLSIAALMTSQFGRYAGQQRGSSDAVTACDAALEYAYAQWKLAVRNAISGGNIPAPGSCGSPTMWLTFNTTYGGSTGFAKSGVVCPSPAPLASPAITIQATDQNGQTVDLLTQKDISTATPVGIPTQNVPGYPGWGGTAYSYVATAKVTSPSHFGGITTVKAKRYFQITRVPLFQAAIFYENKLEIHPGDAMKVTGLVHTNSDLWAQGFSTLQFMSNVSYVGAFHQAADPSVYDGWDGYYVASNLHAFPGSSQQITWANGSTYSNPSGATTQLNQVTAIDPFGGASTSNNGLHDIIDVPSASNPNTIGNNQIAYNNASLIITVNTALAANNLPGRYTITDGNGVPLTGSDYTNVLAAIGGNTNPTATSTTTSTITDMREASTNVTITNLDMGLLANATLPAAQKSADTWQTQFAAKPTVYIQDIGTTTSGSRRAIRLINGGNLGQNVSVASNNGMYIQGDYNVGYTSSTSKPSDVPSNVSATDANGNPSSPVVPGGTKYSSSVMADAVTILSNNWQDSRSNNALAGDPANNYSGNTTTGRVATATTVNTAILAGDVPSNLNGDGIASGGAHNFPRLLEDWTGKDFTYYGSLVEAFRSTKYTGNWQTGNVYTWPVRLWNFDTNFLTNPPPGAPAGMQFSRGRYQRVQ